MSVRPYTVFQQPGTIAPLAPQQSSNRFLYVQQPPIHQPLKTITSISNGPSFFTKRYRLLTIIGSLILLALVCVAVGVPIAQAFLGPAKTTTTTSTTTTITTSTTTSATTTTTTTEAPLRWNTTATTIVGSLTSTNATPLYINFPICVHIDSNDVLYVCDSRNNRIQKYTLGNNTGTTVAGQSNGNAGNGSNQLNYPQDVTTDSYGNIYVADSYNNRVVLWNVNATAGILVAGNGIAGNLTNQLNVPRAVVYDTNTNTLYVSDSGNNRILRFVGNSTNGTLVAGGSLAGNTTTLLNAPRKIYYQSSTNSLVIANSGAFNIVRWPIGGTSWTLVAGSMTYSPGTAVGTYNTPWDVEFDRRGNMYATDRYNYRVQFYFANQTNATVIAGTGVQGSGANQLNEPLGVAIDSQFNVYVADLNNNRIQKFSRVF